MKEENEIRTQEDNGENKGNRKRRGVAALAVIDYSSSGAHLALDVTEVHHAIRTAAYRRKEK